MTLITPTIGRQVWFRPSKEDTLHTGFGEPLAATICRVWNDRMVNLQVIDVEGRAHARTSVLLLQGDEGYAPVTGHCEWVPRVEAQAGALLPMWTVKTKDAVLTIGSEAELNIAEVNVINTGASSSIASKNSRIAAEAMNACLEIAQIGKTPFGEPSKYVPLSFGTALHLLKEGGKVARTGWNGTGLWLQLQRPDAGSKMTLPYLFLSYPDDAKNTPGARVPWLASQTDVLANDWCQVH